RQPERRREIHQRLQYGLLVATEVTLQLDPDVSAAEHGRELCDESTDAVPLGLERRPARERDESVRLSLQILQAQIELALRRLQLRARDDPAELLVALGRLHEHRQRPRRRRTSGTLRDLRVHADRELSADDGF